MLAGRRQARLKNLIMGAEKVVQLEKGRDTRRLLGEANSASCSSLKRDNEQTPGVGEASSVWTERGVQASSEKDDGSLGALHQFHQ